MTATTVTHNGDVNLPATIHSCQQSLESLLLSGTVGSSFCHQWPMAGVRHLMISPPLALTPPLASTFWTCHARTFKGFHDTRKSSDVNNYKQAWKQGSQVLPVAISKESEAVAVLAALVVLVRQERAIGSFKLTLSIRSRPFYSAVPLMSLSRCPTTCPLGLHRKAKNVNVRPHLLVPDRVCTQLSGTSRDLRSIFDVVPVTSPH